MLLKFAKTQEPDNLETRKDQKISAVPFLAKSLLSNRQEKAPTSSCHYTAAFKNTTTHVWNRLAAVSGENEIRYLSYIILNLESSSGEKKKKGTL